MKQHTVLAYGATIAGAQGRTTDTGHVLVTPRTNAASLYVGMTRGRQTNHAHVITDGHDHDELDLGHKTGAHGFADALARNPDGDTSATTVKKQYAAAEAERQLEKRIKATALRWKHERKTLTPNMRARLKGHDVEIVKALLDADSPINMRVHDAACAVDWNRPNVAAEYIAAVKTNKPSAAARPHQQSFDSTPTSAYDDAAR